MTATPKPKKPRPQGVFLLAIKIAGNSEHCRRFARTLAGHAEDEYAAHLGRSNADPSIVFEANLCKWEKL
jgi:hypothetical protein